MEKVTRAQSTAVFRIFVTEVVSKTLVRGHLASAKVDVVTSVLQYGGLSYVDRKPLLDSTTRILYPRTYIHIRKNTCVCVGILEGIKVKIMCYHVLLGFF